MLFVRFFFKLYGFYVLFCTKNINIHIVIENWTKITDLWLKLVSIPVRRWRPKATLDFSMVPLLPWVQRQSADLDLDA